MFEHDNIKIKLSLASGITIILLVILLSIPLLGVAFLSDEVSFTVLGLVVLISMAFNLIIFLLSPLLMDLMLKSQYGSTTWSSLHNIQDSHPISSSCIKSICNRYRISEPKIAVVRDKNPFAFTYGNLPRNARILVSSELLSFLKDEELAAVYAHELGHIIRYDFALMTLAQSITICFYWFFEVLRKSNNTAAKGIGILSFLLYYLSFFVSLYLSRTREFSADYFAAENTQNPSALSTALAKISYATISGRHANTLTEGARDLNIFDIKMRSVTSSDNDQEIQESMWNIFHSSSRSSEMRSTHPHPAKRIAALANYTERKKIDFNFDLSEIILEAGEIRKNLDSFYDYEKLTDTDSDYQIEAGSAKIVIRYNKVFLLILLLLALCPLAYGAFLISIMHQNQQASAEIYVFVEIYVISAFFIGLGICCVYRVLELFSPISGYLLLNSSGLEIRHPLFIRRKILFKWSEIEKIGISNRKPVKRVGLNFSRSYTGKRRGILSLINRIGYGYDFNLDWGYEKNSEELASILRKWKDFHS